MCTVVKINKKTPIILDYRTIPEDGQFYPLNQCGWTKIEEPNLRLSN